ncbi:MAG: flagellar hook-length control protein FliK [Burkholderiales bacterium]
MGADVRGRNAASRIPQSSKAEAVFGNPATHPRDPAGVTDITKPESHNFAALPDAPTGLRERVPDKASPEDARFARPHELPEAALAGRAPAVEMPPRAEPPVAKEALPPDLLAAPPGGPSALSAPTTPLTPQMSATSAHAASASSSLPPPATAHITAPFGHAEWADQFRDKVVWLVDRQQQTAELHIHPPHLGPVEVMLTLNDEKTSIAFVSAHPAVREAIEASFADLRATLEQRGLALDHSSVSADARDAREQLSQNAESARRLGGKVAATADDPQRARLAHYGLVDTFA